MQIKYSQRAGQEGKEELCCGVFLVNKPTFPFSFNRRPIREIPRAIKLKSWLILFAENESIHLKANESNNCVSKTAGDTLTLHFFYL